MRRTLAGAALMLLPLGLIGCDRGSQAHHAGDGHDHGAAASSSEPATPTNRVDIPAAVRLNLGITFATAEYRNVAQTLRVPGQFELLPTARRDYRTPVGGRVELLVQQYQKVDLGTPLYQVDSAGWRELHELIAATQAQVDAMGPLREAHRVHERSLAEKVALWKERLEQLEELRSVGGGNAAQFTEARATLNDTQAELAGVIEKDAELQAQHKRAEAELRALTARRDLLIRSAGGDPSMDSQDAWAGLYTVHAMAPGVVETLGVTPGGLVEENGSVISLVQPDQIRFRARGLQSDLGRLRDGLPTRIAPPSGGSIPLQEVMAGSLQLGLIANADDRTLDLIVQPDTLASWARTGISAYLEITLAGGQEELAIPVSAVVRDGATPLIFRRDPANPDRAIRMEADLGLSDGRWVVIASGVREGDQIMLGGNYQLMLATSASVSEAGHFHADGTFHAGDH